MTKEEPGLAMAPKKSRGSFRELSTHSSGRHHGRHFPGRDCIDLPGRLETLRNAFPETAYNTGIGHPTP
jgi:hypothetical protein